MFLLRKNINSSENGWVMQGQELVLDARLKAVRCLKCEALLLDSEWSVVAVSSAALDTVVLKDGLSGKDVNNGKCGRLLVSGRSFEKLSAIGESVGSADTVTIFHTGLTECPALFIRTHNSGLLAILLPELMLLVKSRDKETVLRRLRRISESIQLQVFDGISPLGEGESHKRSAPRRKRMRIPLQPSPYSASAYASESDVLTYVNETTEKMFSNRVSMQAVKLNVRKILEAARIFERDELELGSVGEHVSYERFLLIVTEAVLLSARSGMIRNGNRPTLHFEEQSDSFDAVIISDVVELVRDASVRVSELLLLAFGARVHMDVTADRSRLTVSIPYGGEYYYDVCGRSTVPELEKLVGYIGEAVERELS